MKKESSRIASAEKLAAMLDTLETSDLYQIEYLKLEITEQIYCMMQLQGISNADLARKLGKSRQYVTKVLKGTANFTLESLVKISMALNCRIGFDINLKQKDERLQDYLSALKSQSNSGCIERSYIRLIYSAPVLDKEMKDERLVSAA